jgi:hypothetical protein
MSSTIPTRFDAELFAAAKAAGSRTHRSAAQQIAYWARLGRELEASASISSRDIDRVLAGQMPYDELAERDQAVVRTAWGEAIDDRIESLDLRTALAAEGRGHASELDADGAVTVRALAAPGAPQPRSRR